MWTAQLQADGDIEVGRKRERCHHLGLLHPNYRNVCSIKLFLKISASGPDATGHPVIDGPHDENVGSRKSPLAVRFGRRLPDHAIRMPPL